VPPIVSSPPSAFAFLRENISGTLSFASFLDARNPPRNGPISRTGSSPAVWGLFRGDFPRRSNYDRRQSFAAETVALEHSVVRNNAQLLYAGVGDEHPIEWITVCRRETATTVSPGALGDLARCFDGRLDVKYSVRTTSVNNERKQ
jgi:hypothetical protein